MEASPEPPEPPEEAERRTAEVELLWDLVFVFAVTRVTTMMRSDLTWAGFGRAMLALALVWWAWSAFAWVANAQEPEAWRFRLTMLVATALIFLVGLAVPRAFGSDGTLFAITYTGVRLLHLALYVDAARRGNAQLRAITGFAVTVAIGMALLIGGSLLHGFARVSLWILAAAIDYAGPAWLTRDRLRELQRVAVAHFAERYGLFVIICLGESIVGVGTAVGGHLGFGVVAGVSIALLITVALWWTYFDRRAGEAQEALRRNPEPVLAGADGYSYLHLLLVAGILIFAVGAHDTVSRIEDPLHAGARLALCGGVALYLGGLAAFRARLGGGLGVGELTVGAAALVLFAVSGGFPAWLVGALLLAELAALIAFDALSAPAEAERESDQAAAVTS